MNRLYKAYSMPNDKYCIQHFGIKGQKWGVRNYEGYDGLLTPEGKERYYGGSKGNKPITVNPVEVKPISVKPVTIKTINDETSIKNVVSSYTSALNLISKFGAISAATLVATALGVGGYYAGKKLKRFLDKKKSMKVSEVTNNKKSTKESKDSKKKSMKVSEVTNNKKSTKESKDSEKKPNV